MHPRLTIGQVVTGATLGLVLAVAALIWFVTTESRRALDSTSELLRVAHTERIAMEIKSFLEDSQRSLGDIASSGRERACDPNDPAALERCFTAMLLSRPNLSEISLTRAKRTGFDESGHAILAAGGRWQLTVLRETPNPGSPLRTRWTHDASGTFVSDERNPLEPSATFTRMSSDAGDPTDHPTFQTPVARPYMGKRLWSDLSYSQLDAALPEAQQRVVVTLLNSFEIVGDDTVYVIRLAVRTEKLDDTLMEESATNAPHRIFLCDSRGRLISRLTPGERMVEMDGELRVDPAGIPPEVSAALASPEIRMTTPDRKPLSRRINVDDTSYLATFGALPLSQGWIVGIVVPESYYQGELNSILRSVVFVSVVLVGLMLTGAIIAMRSMRGGLRRVETEINRIRGLEFTASPTDAGFRDISDALDSLEQAKTALRAMSRYVPVDLVRQLFQQNVDPVLGGELKDVSLLFSDVEGFTSLAESMPPDALSEMLGRYLDVMTRCVHDRQGTVDKYIGDAVMAIWNAPADVDDHALKACLTAVAIQSALDELHASPEWSGRPRLTTRVGVHRGTVLVGNFGSHDRLNYTAIGDDVNLASRLEGLNKQYGTRVLATDVILAATGDALETRRIDRVAVKGKSQGVPIREILGLRGSVAPGRLAAARAYEQALDAYFEREFERAAAILRTQQDDPPSRILLRRCEELLSDPPPPDWNGVWAATSK